MSTTIPAVCGTSRFEEAVNAVAKLEVNPNAKRGDVERVLNRCFPVPRRTSHRLAPDEEVKQLVTFLAARCLQLAVVTRLKARHGYISTSDKFHQRAVRLLVETALSGGLSGLNLERTYHPNEVPSLIRLAIEEQKTRNSCPHETAILESALALLEQARGGRTQELEDFYSSLAAWIEDAKMRVKYPPHKCDRQLGRYRA
jgi:hypothetical protein